MSEPSRSGKADGVRAGRGWPRVASLLPSATEIVCALGARDALCGRSHECDFPPGVEAVPVLTRSLVRDLPTSGAIDRDVRALVKDVLAVYELELEGLRDAAPEVVVTQDLCDVCAVSYDDVCAAARELGGDELEIVSLHPTRLADVLDDVRRVGRALGAPERAEEVVGAMEARIAAVRERARGLERPRVLTIEWTDPVMVGGTWMPELVELAGGEPLLTRPGDRAPTLSAAELAELRPDVVLVKPCGFDLGRTRAESGRIASLAADSGWPAARSGSVWLADGNAFFNRPGPRLAESLEILAACVHPEAFADLARTHAASFERLRT